MSRRILYHPTCGFPIVRNSTRRLLSVESSGRAGVPAARSRRRRAEATPHSLLNRHTADDH